MTVRFNHMELTVPKGTLTDERRQELTDFYGGVFGWETRDVEILGGRQFFMQPTEGQFILVAESSLEFAQRLTTPDLPAGRADLRGELHP